MFDHNLLFLFLLKFRLFSIPGEWSIFTTISDRIFKVLFQVEIALWYYIDVLMPADRKLKPLSMDQFAILSE